MNIGVLLSGNGVYDGSEIQESVFTLLSIDQHGANAICIAPNVTQHHVVNHITGEEMQEQRNVLIESARIARGNIRSIDEVDPKDLDALIIPGGFGAAKNLTKWAFSGPEGDILPGVKDLIQSIHADGKFIVGLCMGPTVIAKAFESLQEHVHLTVGTDKEPSPYEITEISEGMEKVGAIAEMKSVKEISVDLENKVITAPCYMMEATISEIRNNIKMAVDKLFELM
ncbi:MAG: isoprenoid biosynthesis glyoxalase ElbB [Vicingaceae bacterium]